MKCSLQRYLVLIHVPQSQTPIVSLVATQSNLLTRECYLIDRIDNRDRDTMRHLKCLCFLRPTSESLQWLIAELRDPCYGDYYICTLGTSQFTTISLSLVLTSSLLDFSNTIRKSDVERLAEVDEHEVVREIQVWI
jgi:vacuolar protein sorting-associated protein 45